MIKSARYFFLYLFIIGCVDPYEFVIRNNEPTLVVEAYLSDKSFNETVSYPSDGRYFTVKLTYTSDVTNQRDEVVENASVLLLSDQGGQWVYSNAGEQAGVYTLYDPDFKAVQGVRYKLRITLPDDEPYESDWEELPAAQAAAMGDIGFDETEVKTYKYEAGEKVLKTVRAVNGYIQVPANNAGQPIYYRWNFTPTWIYIAPMALTVSPEKKCWVTNPLYLQDYALRVDNTGGYRQDLFVMETVRNERIYTELSILVKQEVMSEDYYYFWKEMQEQTKRGGLFDAPPYNLQTNLHAQNGKPVSGYFGVVSEQAKRWYFNREDLSYYVEDTLMGDCSVSYGPDGPGPPCTDCREYQNGHAVNAMPGWWGR